jgi:hypothetical protein
MKTEHVRTTKCAEINEPTLFAGTVEVETAIFGWSRMAWPML